MYSTGMQPNLEDIRESFREEETFRSRLKECVNLKKNILDRGNNIYEDVEVGTSLHYEELKQAVERW